MPHLFYKRGEYLRAKTCANPLLLMIIVVRANAYLRALSNVALERHCMIQTKCWKTVKYSISLHYLYNYVLLYHWIFWIKTIYNHSFRGSLYHIVTLTCPYSNLPYIKLFLTHVSQNTYNTVLGNAFRTMQYSTITFRCMLVSAGLWSLSAVWLIYRIHGYQ